MLWHEVDWRSVCSVALFSEDTSNSYNAVSGISKVDHLVLVMFLEGKERATGMSRSISNVSSQDITDPEEDSGSESSSDSSESEYETTQAYPDTQATETCKHNPEDEDVILLNEKTLPYALFLYRSSCR